MIEQVVRAIAKTDGVRSEDDPKRFQRFALAAFKALARMYCEDIRIGRLRTSESDHGFCIVVGDDPTAIVRRVMLASIASHSHDDGITDLRGVSGSVSDQITANIRRVDDLLKQRKR